MNILGIIPCRYSSTRFPAKALADVGGKPMIYSTYHQSKQANCIQDLWVATDHSLIFNTLKALEVPVKMTHQEHLNGTSRCHEIYEQLQTPSFQYVINIQGDTPFIKPEQLNELADMLDGKVEIATLAFPTTDPEVLKHPNTVKVVMNMAQNALYFSRSLLPNPFKTNVTHTHYQHIGIYAYRTDILKKIVQLPVSSLEASESLEQLRWLANGFNIKVGISKHASLSIDSPEDLQKIHKNNQ